MTFSSPLLLFQLLGGSGLAESLTFGPFVSLNVDGRLEGGVPSRRGHDLGPQLSLKVEQPQGSKFDLGLSLDVLGHVDGQTRELVDPKRERF